MIKFRNTPDIVKTEEEKMMKELYHESKIEKIQDVKDIVAKKKYIKKMEFKISPLSGSKIKHILLFSLIGFFIFYFGAKILSLGFKIKNSYSEVTFSIDHPGIVKPIRELYEASHKKADDELTGILSGKE